MNALIASTTDLPSPPRGAWSRLLGFLTGGIRRPRHQGWELVLTDAEVEADLRYGRDDD